jgi:molecular chaperone GrpE
MAQRNSAEEDAGSEGQPPFDDEAPNDEDAAASERIQRLETERDRLKKEVREVREKFLRARADYENYARRAAREVEETIRSHKAALLMRIVDAVENLDKAIDHLTKTGGDVKGLRLVSNDLHKVLKDEGVRPIDTDGVQFNHNHHMAADRTATDEHPEGTILEVYQRGYLLNQRVLRPAMVRVAVPPEKPAKTAAPTRDVSDE